MTTTGNRSFNMAMGIATAIYASILIPLLVFYIRGWILEPAEPVPEELSAAEDTLSVVIEPEVMPVVVVPVEAKPKAPSIRYVRTNSSSPSDEPPEPGSASFISDRNTKAASEMAPNAQGDPNLPSQKGEDSPVLDLSDRDFAHGEYKKAEKIATGTKDSPLSLPAPPQPKIPESTANLLEIVKDAEKKAAEKSKPAPPPAETTTPLVDPSSELVADKPQDRPKEPMIAEPKFEKLFPDPPKAKIAKNQDTPPATPQNPSKATDGTPGAPKGSEADAHQTFTRKNAMSGAIGTRGAKAAVDAADTPNGRFMARVSAAISEKFGKANMLRRDRPSGMVQVEFDINKKGAPENLRIAREGTGNPILQDIVLGVVLEAKLPPIPDEMNEYLIGNRLHITYGFYFQ